MIGLDAMAARAGLLVLALAALALATVQVTEAQTPERGAWTLQEAPR